MHTFVQATVEGYLEMIRMRVNEDDRKGEKSGGKEEEEGEKTGREEEGGGHLGLLPHG